MRRGGLTSRSASPRATRSGSLELPESTLELSVDPRALELPRARRALAMGHRRGWLVRRGLAAADLSGLTLAFLLVQASFRPPAGYDAVSSVQELALFLLSLPAWVVTARVYGLYDRDEVRSDHSTVDDFAGIFHITTIGVWLVYFGVHITGVADPELAKVGAFWGATIAFVTLGRAIARALCRRSIMYLQNAIILGSGPVAGLVARKVLQHPEYGINLVGVVTDDDATLSLPAPPVVPVLGRIEQLITAIRMFDVERVVIALPSHESERAIEVVRSLKDLDVQIDIVPSLFEVVGPSVKIHTLEGMPLLGLPPLTLSRSARAIKRWMDVACAFVGLALLSPLFAIVAIAIKLDSRGPVFFRQLRMGSGERTFHILKFRTMCVDAEEKKPAVAHLNMHVSRDPRMFKIENDPRITRVGRVLRRYLIDELPQLVNVLVGDMSLVGPRPLILDEDRFVGSWARRRLDLKPGITGLWQVLGRSAIPFEEMVKLDYLYVTNWSIGHDLRLLFRTIPLVLRGAGRGF